MFLYPKEAANGILAPIGFSGSNFDAVGVMGAWNLRTGLPDLEDLGSNTLSHEASCVISGHLPLDCFEDKMRRNCIYPVLWRMGGTKNVMDK